MLDLVGNPEDRFSHNEAHLRALLQADQRLQFASGCTSRGPGQFASGCAPRVLDSLPVVVLPGVLEI